MNFPPGIKYIAGEVFILKDLSLDGDIKFPEQILQCNFYKYKSNTPKLVDMFDINREFNEQFALGYRFCMCSVQSM